MPDASLPGVHHVTALCGDAQENLDFYVGVLGLRRVKTTVNFDDPTTHHLYYGDAAGRPGSTLTFFPWPQATSGRGGAGMVHTVAFAVPRGSLAGWHDRLTAHGVEPKEKTYFDEPCLHFSGPSGLPLALVATAPAEDARPWTDGPVPANRAIQGIHAPVLPVFSDDRTLELFTDVFGWARAGTDGDRVRLRGPGTGVGTTVDLLVRDRHPSGRMGRGTVHHIAFRAPDDQAQRAWQSILREHGLQVTDVKDRHYFRSVYFRDPDRTSGLLFEIATNGPGVHVDEDDAELGRSLVLPEHLESRRAELERVLPRLTTP
ncbi:ring-cleaving dioxygenase [Salinibacter altiplanensis]|uniref:ring-cleaving dioxygenase n=1 Tax=Salinibacter altiplanensis TaxID=1803181 RepID=UPI000C9FD804|nr:ring-cleaving dioxygenase [Salinibacter altiplanensis]